MARIGLDVDDTLTEIRNDMLKEAISYDKTLRGKGIINNNYFIGKSFDWTDAEKDYFLKRYRKKIAINAPLRKDVVEVINKLKNEGHYIAIITSRKDEDYDNNALLKTTEFLTKNNIPYDELITNAKEKDKVCKKLNIDYFIDDSPIHVKSVLKIGIKAYLIYNGYDFKENIPIIYNFKELENIINN